MALAKDTGGGTARVVRMAAARPRMIVSLMLSSLDMTFHYVGVGEFEVNCEDEREIQLNAPKGELSCFCLKPFEDRWILNLQHALEQDCAQGSR